MGSVESKQIELIRTLCILSMMWVHVSPGLSYPSVVNSGSFAWVGALFGETLGHIAVTTLSFISGYLLWKSLERAARGRVLSRRFWVLVIPMLVWSALFILLASAKSGLTGQTASAILGIREGGMAAINAWAGLTGPTANLSLFFLRDLFVASCLLCLALPAVRRWPFILWVAVLAVVPFGHLQPVIFRPTVLIFMLVGAWVRQKQLTLTDVSEPRLAFPIATVFILASIFLMSAEPAGASARQDAVAMIIDLCRRVGIGALILALSAAAVRVDWFDGLIRLGRHSYLAYLSHAITIGLLWAAWSWHSDGPPQMRLSYLAFFLFTPFVAFAVAVAGGRILDAAPGVVQMALRGRAQNPRRAAD